MTETRADLGWPLEEFLAKLTAAAYGVSLRYGVKGSSIDLELDLWRELRLVLREQSRSWPGRSILAEPTDLMGVVA
jgi:hypothetical protein